MNRFFIDPKQFKGEIVAFPADISHQIRHVLRLREGDRVAVLDNSGSVFDVAIILTADTNAVAGKIISREMAATEPSTRIALFFGMTNRDKVELILQKGTEVGVSDFFPFVSSRTLVQSTDLTAKKTARWEAIIREAAEQSGRGRLPELHQPVRFEDCLTEVDSQFELALIAWEGSATEGLGLHEVLANEERGAIALYVGPEGGFSENEINLARLSGCNVVSLGARILRMETAAILFPALVLFALRE